MAGPEPSGEMPMFPGMVQMIVCVIPAGIVTHPLIVCFHVRGVGMPWLVAIIASGHGWLLLTVCRLGISSAAVLRGRAGLGCVLLVTASRSASRHRSGAVRGNVSAVKVLLLSGIPIAATALFVSVLRKDRKSNQQSTDKHCKQ